MGCSADVLALGPFAFPAEFTDVFCDFLPDFSADFESAESFRVKPPRRRLVGSFSLPIIFALLEVFAVAAEFLDAVAAAEDDPAVTAAAVGVDDDDDADGDAVVVTAVGAFATAEKALTRGVWRSDEEKGKEVDAKRFTPVEGPAEALIAGRPRPMADPGTRGIESLACLTSG